MRLDQFLSSHTMYSRKQLKDMIAHGKSTVDGEIVRKPELHIKPESQKITLNGQEIANTQFLYVLLNKPKGYVTSLNEPGQKTVMELIPPEMCRKDLAPVGRLDKDSTGLLLFTDDGQLAHQMIRARSHVTKLYHVILARPWEDSYADAIAKGLDLADGTHCLPAQAKLVENTTHEAYICLNEGKYHQVRRMFAALGNHVEELERLALGGLEMPSDLTPGNCKILSEKDVQKITNFNVKFELFTQSQ